MKGNAEGDWQEPSATRAVICRTLGKLRHPEARSAILKAVNDSDPMVRAEACRALGAVGTQEDATILTRVMTADTSVDCRVAAVDGLGQLKSADPRINTFLAQSMGDDEDPAIRLASLNALRAITGKDLGVEPKPWQDYVASTIPATPTPVIVARPSVPRPGQPAPPSLPSIDPRIQPAAAPR
jgi:HEAT repeat protein